MKQSRHLIEARRAGILKMLKERKKMRVEELSNCFQVSELTIRRDLEELDKKGEIVRFFGGAEIREEAMPVMKFTEKEVINREEKELVAQCAADLIQRESSIFMNSGTTVLEVMKRIKNKHATIITNNAQAGNALENGNCDLLCTGGIYNSATCSFIGEYSTNLIKETFAETAVLGVNGINVGSGITTSLFQETVLFKLMLERCRGKKIIVTDGSKVGRTKNYKSADIKQIDILITTSRADPQELEKIKNAGIQLILTDE